MNEFIVNAKLPSLNEYINFCRSNKYQANEYKRNVEEVIGWAIRMAVVKGQLKPMKTPCRVRFTWYEKTAKRDCDNIASAKKFILDAMQKQGIIENDNQKCIVGFEDIFKKSDRNAVLVQLLPE